MIELEERIEHTRFFDLRCHSLSQEPETDHALLRQIFQFERRQSGFLARFICQIELLLHTFAMKRHVSAGVPHFFVTVLVEERADQFDRNSKAKAGGSPHTGRRDTNQFAIRAVESATGVAGVDPGVDTILRDVLVGLIPMDHAVG